MSLPVFVGIRFIPIEPGTSIQRILTFHHDAQYISDIYTAQSGQMVIGQRRRR
jgi:hypothetical protein